MTVKIKHQIDIFEKSIYKYDLNGNVMNKVILQFGGNRGNVMDNFSHTIEKLEASAGKVLLKSKIYETEPWGYDDKRWFLNQIIELETQLNPFDLLELTQSIEKELGRTVKKSEWLYEGRPIDIDILFFNQEMVHTEKLMIPHPHIRFRRFVLKPLTDHWADFVHPEFDISIARLLEACDDPGIVRLHQHQQELTKVE
jgi:2-amino-4-hydroxy-6-hydroxymethyldihydropteridine diphosphokinase